MSEKEKRFSYGLLGTTFQKDQNYLSARFQKMVPIFDVDLNEMDDIRRHHTEQLWRLLFGEGPSIIVMNEWEKKQGTFMGYKSEAEPGHGNPRDYIPFAPSIVDKDELQVHSGDFYWRGYWIHCPKVKKLNDYLREGKKRVHEMRQFYSNEQSAKVTIPPVEDITTVLKGLSTSTQVCVLAVHAWVYLLSPDQDGSLKRPVGGGSDAMPTCSRLKLDWTYRFMQVDDFMKLHQQVEKSRKAPYGDKETLCPLKLKNQPAQEVIFPLYAFQIKNREIDSISKTQAGIRAFQLWVQGETFSAEDFAKAYAEVGSFGQFNRDKIYIQRLRNLLMNK